MAVDDLDSLRSELPELFSDKELPATWEEDWLFVKVDDPESSLPSVESMAPPDNVEAWLNPSNFDEIINDTAPALDFGEITIPDFG